VAAHILTAREDSDIVAAGLREVCPLQSYGLILTVHRSRTGASIGGDYATCLQTTRLVSNALCGRPSQDC
jgi:hypothetical protein